MNVVKILPALGSINEPLWAVLSREVGTPQERPGIFFDTNVCINAASGAINREEWARLLHIVRTRYTYYLSPLTGFELLNSVGNSSPENFLKNRLRLQLLLQPSVPRFLSFIRRFIRKLLYGQPVLTPCDLELQFWNCAAMIQWIESFDAMNDFVQLPFLAHGRLLRSFLKEEQAKFVETQNAYVSLMEGARESGDTTRKEEAWMRGLLKENGLIATPELVSQVRSQFDAAYRFEVQMYRQAKNDTYDFEERNSDLVDAQQLCYLALPNLFFLTQDRRMRTWIGDSPQASRLVTVEELLSAQVD